MLDLSSIKLKDLKERVHEAWSDVLQMTRCINLSSGPDDPEFKKEIKKLFGDLRKKITWATAYATYYAKSTIASGLDASAIILASYDFVGQERWDAPLKELMIDKLLERPEAVDLMKTAFEQLIGQPLSTEERGTINEFLGLACKATGGAERLPAGLVWGTNRTLATATH